MVNVYRNWESIRPGIKWAVTIGNFDGVHRGHRAILERLHAVAARRGETPLVVTFANHTSEVVRHSWPPLLMDVEERLEAIAASGINDILLLDFTEALSHLTAEQFFGQLIAAGAGSFVVGHDFRCGAGGVGTTRYLLEYVGQKGLCAVVVPAVRMNREIVSSTRVRQLIADGRIDEARHLLGHPFRMGGEVCHGEARGRTLGFPTANLTIESHRIIPRYGVYLVSATIDGGQVHYGLGNVGVKPTFREMPPLLEVFLMDFDADIYGCRMEVDFLSFLRAERRFGSAEELIAQMRQDVTEGRKRLVRMEKTHKRTSTGTK